MAALPRYSTVSGAAPHIDPVLKRSYGRASPAVVREARLRATVAEATLRLVEAQTVFALLRAGWTVREIADDTGISKSEVGRLRKLTLDTNDNPIDGWLEIDEDLGQSVARETAKLWSQY